MPIRLPQGWSVLFELVGVDAKGRETAPIRDGVLTGDARLEITMNDDALSGTLLAVSPGLALSITATANADPGPGPGVDHVSGSDIVDVDLPLAESVVVTFDPPMPRAARLVR